MQTLIDRTCRVLDMAIAACLAVMVVLVFGNVVLRYGFNSGITVSEELSRWLFVWMTFLGATVALKDHAHLGTDMLVGRLGVAGKKVCFVIAHLMMLGVCGLVFQGAWVQARINWKATSAVMEASMGWLYVPGLIFAVLGGLIVLMQLVRLLAGRLDEAQLIAFQESEEKAHAPAGPSSAPRT